MLLDGAPPGEGAPEVADSHEDPIPDILVPSVLSTDVLACIEAAQQRQDAT